MISFGKLVFLDVNDQLIISNPKLLHLKMNKKIILTSLIKFSFQNDRVAWLRSSNIV